MSWPRPVPLVGDPTSAGQRARDPHAWRLGEQARQAVYGVIAARRDIRRFRPDPIEPGLVERLLNAAHAGPSVGHCQPWRFVLVRSAETRERAALVAERERQRQAGLLSEDAGRRMLDLQLDGIREAPLGVVVCCDRRTQALGVLGRATFPDTDLWSCACAIENLWLAARVEGLGVGWVTLFPPDELAQLVRLPPGVETLGWLCMGWPDERPPAPGLERAGWSRRAPLASVVLHEHWPDDPPSPPTSLLKEPPTGSIVGPGARATTLGPGLGAVPGIARHGDGTAGAIHHRAWARGPDQEAVVRARDQADQLLTPPGSLGVLDKALDRLAAIGIERAPRVTLVLCAADHPVARHGVSIYATSVTREVLEATVAGESLGAAAARAAGAAIVAVDAGVDGGPVPGTLNMRPNGRRGDLVGADALEPSDVAHLLRSGRQVGADIPGRLVALGEVGVGNTTVAAALAAGLLGLGAEEAVGLGAGGDMATLDRKRLVVEMALERFGARSEPLETIAALGGPEVVVMAGVVLGAAEAGKAIVLDGLATSVAALVAVRLQPGVATYLVAGQRSRERAHPAVLEQLGLEPLLDLRMRAGEGVGAVLSSQLLAHGLTIRAWAARVTP